MVETTGLCAMRLRTICPSHLQTHYRSQVHLSFHLPIQPLWAFPELHPIQFFCSNQAMSAGVGSQYYSAFNPLDIGGCALWLDAADQSTLTLSGTNVTQWRDKSGNNYHQAQSTTANQPIYTTFSNRPYVSYVAASSNFTSNTSMGIDYRNSQIFLVFQRRANTSGGIFSPLTVGQSGDWNRTDGFTIIGLVEVASAGSGANDGTSTNTNLTSYAFTISNNNLTTFRDFGSSSVITRAMGLTAVPNGLYLGIRRDGPSLNYPGDVYFGEALVFNRLLTTTEYQLIEGYLSRKWFRTGFPAAIIPFAPTQISGCAVWLDAADSNSLTFSGSNVSQWRDKSVNGINASQATASNQPVYQSNSINGLPSIQFPAIARNNIVCFDTPAFDFGTSARTSFFVLKNNYVSGTPGSSPHWFWPKTGNGSAAQSLVGWIQSVNRSTFVSLAISAPIGPTFILTNIFGSSTNVEQMYTNGNSSGGVSLTRSAAFINATSGYRIGGVDNADVVGSTYWFDGNIGEIVLFNRALTNTEIQQVEGYLAMKWGLQSSLPSTHPYALLGVPSTHPYFSIVPVTRQFAPIDIPNCALWLDATDPNSMTLSGSNITQWNDKSGNGRNMTASGTITNTGSINGLTAANWASDAYFYGSASNTGTTVTVFAVFNMTSSTSGGAARVVSLGVSGTNDFDNISSAVPILRRTGTIVGAYRNGTELSRNTNAIDQVVLMCSLFNGSSNTIYTNGTASTSVANTGTFNYTQHRIGASTNAADTNSLFKGTIGEVIIYNDALSDINRQVIEGYLSRKWFRTGSTYITVPFSPTQISGCQLWLDAADTTTITSSGGSISQWRDKSSSGLVLSQSTSSNQPTLGPLLNNLQTIQFTTTQTLASTTNLVTNPAQSWFLVFNAYNNSNTNRFFLNHSSNIDVTGGEYFFGGNGTIWANKKSGNLALQRAIIDSVGLSVTPFNSGQWYSTNIVDSNTTTNINSFSFRINGSNRTIQIYASYSNILSGTANINFFINQIGANMYISEIILYNAALPLSQVQQIEGYLANKWGLFSSLPANHPYARIGLPSTHPYISRNPRITVFNPRQISGCALWLDGADPNSMTLSGSNVTQWNDKSGNGRNTSSLTGTATLLTNSVNAKQGVYFNGTSYFTGPFSYSSNTLSWFVVGTVESDGEAYGRLLSFGTSGQYDYDSAFRLNALSREGSANEIITYRNAFIARNAFVTYGTPFVYSSVIDGTSNYPYLNGRLATGAATSGNFGFSSYGISSSIGLNVQRNKGYIFEVLIYSNALTTPQRQQIEGYLAWKWGLVGSITTIVPFTPTQISGCSLWLDGADSATIDLSGTMVTQWRDKSGNARNTSAVVGTPQISLAGGFGSLPAIYFGSNTAFTGSISYTGTTLTAFVVARVNTAANPLRFFSLGQSGRNDYAFTSDIAVLTTGNATTELGWYRNFGGVGTGSANVTTIYNSPFLYSLTVNGSTGVILLNGSTTSSGTTSGSFGYTAYAIGAGFTPTLGNYLGNGYIAEVILYHDSLTTTQRQQVETYLTNKWGLSSSIIPSSHPYRIIKP